MIFVVQVMSFNHEGSMVPNWIVLDQGDSLEEAFAKVKAMVGQLAEDSPPGDEADPLREFIASLPDDCKNNFHLFDVLAMFQIDARNVLQKDTPHTREAFVRELRRRNR
jgi:hypothetical protein